VKYYGQKTFDAVLKKSRQGKKKKEEFDTIVKKNKMSTKQTREQG